MRVLEWMFAWMSVRRKLKETFMLNGFESKKHFLWNILMGFCHYSVMFIQTVSSVLFAEHFFIHKEFCADAHVNIKVPGDEH